MDAKTFFAEITERLKCDARRAEGLTLAVFYELAHRLTAKEVADVAAQMPAAVRQLWQQPEHRHAAVDKTHKDEFVGRVRQAAGLTDDVEAERAVLAVFAALQKLLGSPTGMEGEAWDIFSQLPKDLKQLWLAAA
jgi:uncharacterized protein (DUF2267 family)